MTSSMPPDSAQPAVHSLTESQIVADGSERRVP
jgi:hypothetical protein